VAKRKPARATRFERWLQANPITVRLAVRALVVFAAPPTFKQVAAVVATILTKK